MLALEDAGVEPAPPAVDVFLALDDGAPRERVASWLAELRETRASRATRTTRGGRSKASSRTRRGWARRTTVVVRGDGATVRRAGADDVEVSLDDLPASVLA